MSQGNVVMSSTTHLSTQAMTQRACDPLCSVVVEACAGSGKTWLLVSRIVRLLLDGISPSEILAITFTRKAAEEMRARLNQWLREFAVMDDASLVRELVSRGMSSEEAFMAMPRARELFEVVLSDPRGVTIDTFHGWFAKLISGAPLSAGVVQGLRLRQDAQRLQQECTEDWWSLLMTEDKAAVRLAYEDLVMRLNDGQANQLLFGKGGFLSMKAEWRRLLKMAQSQARDLEEFLFDGADSVWLNKLDPLIKHLSDPQELQNLIQLEKFFAQGSVREREFAAAISEGIRLFKDGAPSPVIAKALHFAFLDAKTFEPKQNKVTKELEKVLQARTDGAAMIAAIKDARQGWGEVLQFYHSWYAAQNLIEVTKSWSIVGQDLLRHYQAQKEALRVQEFSDLEAYAAEMMLRADVGPYIQARLDAHYRHLLIDEFQDTNPLQWQILLAWLDAYEGADQNRPKVFLVGDPKQSIYRFRRADVRLFQAAKEYLCEHYEASYLPLNVTRRNSDAVLAGVNQIFQASVLPEGYPFQAQSRHPDAHAVDGQFLRLPLIPYPELETLEHRQVLLEACSRPNQIRLMQTYEEALQVGQVILGLRRNEGVAWEDVLVLVRSRTHLARIQQAFRELKIPHDGANQGGLLKTLEADDLIALLTVLLSPKNNLALAQVLRSPIYAWSTEQLTAAHLEMRHTDIDHLWSYLEAHQGPIYEQLTAWRHLAQFLPVHDLLDRIYFEAQLRQKYAQACSPLLRAKVLANLDAFLSLALDIDGGRYPSLARFIQELRIIKRGAEQESPDEGDAHEDFAEDVDEPLELPSRVRIMTIHAAKGLEADYVFLLDTNTKRTHQDHTGTLMQWYPQDLGPRHLTPFYSSARKDPLRDQLRSEEERIAEFERWNLLYVAMTRAKRSFYLSACANKGEVGLTDGSWYQIASAVGIDELPMAHQGSQIEISDEMKAPQSIEDFTILLKAQSPALLSDPTPVALDFQLQRQQQMIGTHMHRMLEYLARYQLLSSDKIPDLESLLAWLSIDKKYGEPAYQAMRRLLQGSMAQKIMSRDDDLRSWEEWDFVDAQGQLIRIDRLIEFSDSYYLLDYKLTVPAVGSPELQTYEKQLGRYYDVITRDLSNKPIFVYLLGADQQSYEWRPDAHT